MIEVGEIRKTLIPYYDTSQSKNLVKSRPALIIARADSDDYVVLPISRITRQNNRNAIYDIEVDPSRFPLLNLNAVSYVRTHKQTVVHRAEIGDLIGDIRSNYEELYFEILEKRELFSKEITEQAL